MDIVQTIREHEKSVLSSVENINEILSIAKLIKTHPSSTAIQLAGLHSCRRLFLHLLENHTFLRSHESEETRTIYLWLRKQYEAFKSTLFKWIVENKENLIAPSIRTLLEFCKKDYLQFSSTNITFGCETFSRLIEALVRSADLDIDVVLMLREEVLNDLICEIHLFLCSS